MKRCSDDGVQEDLKQKMVVLTGPHQVGKTTLCRQLINKLPGSQYLNHDVAAHRAVVIAQCWRASAALLLLDEIHMQASKVYSYDTGLVQGDEGIRFENLMACHLLRNVRWEQDIRGATVDPHYIRTKDGAGVDFCLSEGNTLTHRLECELPDRRAPRSVVQFAAEWPQAQAIQLARRVPRWSRLDGDTGSRCRIRLSWT